MMLLLLQGPGTAIENSIMLLHTTSFDQNKIIYKNKIFYIKGEQNFTDEINIFLKYQPSYLKF